MNTFCLCWMETERIFLCAKAEKLGGLVVGTTDPDYILQWIPPVGSKLRLIGKDKSFNYYELETENRIVILEQGVNSLNVREFMN